MDSMVNRYTADRRRRSDDAYSPGGQGGHRPDRSVIVYAQRCREAWPDAVIVLGGIEASLRRAAHYDYWSDQVRRSILLDAKADILVYGNGERPVVEIAWRLAEGQPLAALHGIRGTVTARGTADAPPGETLELPSYEQVSSDPVAHARAARLLHLAGNPERPKTLVQRHGDRLVCIHPPALPLDTAELDAVFELPYTRRPHPAYGDRGIPAWEMIRFSVTLMRGCFGGCSFCSLTDHEGRIIQSRSEDSVLREIQIIRDQAPGFTGIISDLGGPTANMYRMGCRDAVLRIRCRRSSCLFPGVCPNLTTSHAPLIHLYRRVRGLPGIKKVLIGSGVRYDLALRSPEYVRELVFWHVGGYLKVAPEHTEPGPLALMQKPGPEEFERFQALFTRYSRQAGKEQYLIPYLIAAHPGTTDQDMLRLALWLKAHDFRPEQVQTFLPSPMTLSTIMYHTGLNPLKDPDLAMEPLDVPRGERIRRLHKAFLRYHDPDNWPVLRQALSRMGREDLIGSGRHQLVPAFQPRGTGGRPEGIRTPGQKRKGRARHPGSSSRRDRGHSQGR
jgi:uncharacterized radical SAM protein YgiQ